MPPFTSTIFHADIGSDTYCADAADLWQPVVARAVFGGQLIAHALLAMWRTVDGARSRHIFPHSIHLFFLAAADVTLPIEYFVTRLRDGKRYHVRSCTAKQRGVALVAALGSFHDADAEDPLPMSHRLRPPPAPRPEELPDERARLLALRSDPRLPASIAPIIAAQLEIGNPVDVRYARALDPILPGPEPPRQVVWMRMQPHGLFTDRGSTSGAPDETPASSSFSLGNAATIDPAAAAAAFERVQEAFASLAFISDYSLLMSSLLPHGPARHMTSHMASLDHALWFHDIGAIVQQQQSSLDSSFASSPPGDRWRGAQSPWYLFELHSPSLRDGRGYAHGRLYSESGVMLASAAQEGVVRIRSNGPTPSLTSAATTAGSNSDVGRGAVSPASDTAADATTDDASPSSSSTPNTNPLKQLMAGGVSGRFSPALFDALHAMLEHVEFPAPGWDDERAAATAAIVSHSTAEDTIAHVDVLPTGGALSSSSSTSVPRPPPGGEITSSSSRYIRLPVSIGSERARL